MAVVNLAPFLNVFSGDAGQGGTKGLVPAPPAGSAAAGEFLKADGSWAVPSGPSGGVTSVGVYDSQAAVLKGLTISGSVLYAQSATTSNPGMVNTIAQTFQGQKTFATGLTGTLTGTATSAASFTGSLAGDITGTQSATVIAANAVTYGKFQQVAASSLVGNANSSLANAEAISLGASLTFSSATINTIQAITTGSTPSFAGITLAAFQLTTGANNGFILVSDVSGNGVWGNPDIGTVTALAGTTNQIIVSAPVGAVTLSAPQNLNTTANFQVGTLEIGGSAYSASSSYMQEILGTVIDLTSTSQVGLIQALTFSPTTNATNSYGIWSDPTFIAASTFTITNAASFVASLILGSNIGTITSAYGFFYDGSGTPAGTAITNIYGGYFTTPVTGSVTANLALYSDNLSIGYSAANLYGTNNAVIEGQTSIGTVTPNIYAQLTVNSTKAYNTYLSGTTTLVDGSNDQIGIYQSQIFEPTSGSTTSYGVWSTPSIIAPSGKTIGAAAGIAVSLTLNANVGTITDVYGYYFSGTTAKSGTVTNAYGAYFTAPTATTSSGNLALYSDNLSVGYPISSLHSTNNAVIKGQTAIGTATVNSAAQLTVSSILAYNTVLSGTTAVVDGNSNQIGLYQSQVFAPTSGADVIYGFWSQPVITVPTGQTVTLAAAYAASCIMTGNSGTITSYAGFYYDGTGTVSGTLTNIYGGYFTTPRTGSSTGNLALYADNMSIGNNGLNLNDTNNLYVAGTTITTYFQMPTGGALDYVLTSDASGNGTWGPVEATPVYYNVVAGDSNLVFTISSDPYQSVLPTAARTYTLPTTSVPSGYNLTIVNQSLFLITVQSSGSNLVGYVYPRSQSQFIALTATPTTAANWEVNYQTAIPATIIAYDSAETFTILTPTNLVVSPTAARTYTLATTGVPVGYFMTITNTSLFTITVNASDATLVGVVYPGGVSQFISLISTPTNEANWEIIQTGYGSNQSIFTGSGSVTIGAGGSPNFICTPTAARTYTLPTTDIWAGSSIQLTNDSLFLITVQSSGANLVGYVYPNSTTQFQALISTPTTAANWNPIYLGVNPSTIIAYDAAETFTILTSPNLVVTPTSARTYTLATTSICAGYTMEITNTANFLITVNSSGANLVGYVLPNSTTRFKALVNTPTTAANWQAVLVGNGANELDTATATTINAMASTQSVSVFTGSTATTLNGITAGYLGQQITIVNNTNTTITINSLSSSASAGNKILTSINAPVIIPSSNSIYCYATFTYMTLSSANYWVLTYISGTQGVFGSITGAAPSAGAIGEQLISTVTSGNIPATGTYGNATSLSLTAGCWDVSALVNIYANGATVTGYSVIGISNNSTPTTFSDSNAGVNQCLFISPSGISLSDYAQGVIPQYRINVSSTTTYYLKYQCVAYSAATPQYNAACLKATRVG